VVLQGQQENHAVTKMNPHERAMYLALRRGQTRAHLDWLEEATGC
jgi:hypothetical protein